MTENEFRKMALALPEAVESADMEHPDFRVGGEIFATMQWPKQGWAMGKLPPDAQQAFIQGAPEGFTAVEGTWGVRGATSVNLRAAEKRTVRDALATAWRNCAPRRLRS